MNQDAQHFIIHTPKGLDLEAASSALKSVDGEYRGAIGGTQLVALLTLQQKKQLEARGFTLIPENNRGL